MQKKFALYDEAADLYDRALSICRATFKDKPHYKTGIYRNNRADIERKRGNYDSALAMYVCVCLLACMLLRVVVCSKQQADVNTLAHFFLEVRRESGFAARDCGAHAQRVR